MAAASPETSLHRVNSYEKNGAVLPLLRYIGGGVWLDVMTRWDIRPSGVQGVLNQTGSAAQPIRKHAKALNKHLNAAAANSGSGLVSAALQKFADSAGDDLAEISGRIGRAVAGTVKATRAYLDGDEEMAREAQRQAAAAPDPGLGDGGRPVPGRPV